MIREEIAKGQYNEAERRLQALSRKTIRDITARRHIAGMWNNLGVQQEKFGGTALSVKAFQQSVAWDPESSLAHLNLTQAYWELRDPAMTPQFLETVIRLAPEDPFPHLALADLLLSEGQVALASTHLKQARARAEHDANHRSYFRQLLAKADAIEPTTTAKKEAAPKLPSTHVEVVRVPESQRMPREETTFDTIVMNSSPNARKIRWEQLMKDYKGKIDVEAAKKFMGDHYDAYNKTEKASSLTLCGHTDSDPAGVHCWGYPGFFPEGAVQGKATDGSLASEMKLWAIIGHPCGERICGIGIPFQTSGIQLYEGYSEGYAFAGVEFIWKEMKAQ